MGERPREVEIKLDIPAARIPGLKRQLSRVERLKGQRRSEILESTYFDTARLDLRDAGLTLRVRRVGDLWIQTIKRSTGSAAGLFDRSEWEQEIRGGEPDFSAARGTALEPLLTDTFRASLKPAFSTSVKRTTYELGNRRSGVKIALDEGRVVAGRRSAPLAEVELELDHGKPATLFMLARRLAKHVPIRIGVKSKSERGYELLEHRTPKAAQAERPRLERGMPTAEAFRMIGRSCLRHLMLNEPIMLRGDREALHQMRVALRRLRAAISLFQDVVAGAEADSVKSILKWMTEQLAPARDLDVLVAEAVTPAERRHPDIAGIKDLHSAAERRRAKAFARARRVVTSARFRAGVLDVTAFIEVGRWRKERGAASKARAQAVEKHAADELSRRRGKVKRKGKRVRRLDPWERHKLRIRIKKIRYAVDFFATLFPGGRARKRRKVFTGILKRLQSALGSLNDIAVRGKLVSSLARERHAPEASVSRRRAFAAGLLSGEQDARVEPLLAEADAAFAELRRIEPFWK